MSCEERKCRILAAVRKIFSRQGLEGTTTRELAKEAGVSEALLYKHYPSKEALYKAMLESCDGELMGEVKKITSLESFYLHAGDAHSFYGRGFASSAGP